MEEPMTLGTPAIFSTLGTCPPPQPSMWKAWIVRPSSTRRVSSTDRHSFSPSLCRATWTSCSSATRSAVSSARVWAPMSSCTSKPLAPPSARASMSGAAWEDEPRPRKPMLTGQASKGVEGVAQRPGRVDADPQTGPNSCPMIVVTPEAREASMMRGDSRSRACRRHRRWRSDPRRRRSRCRCRRRRPRRRGCPGCRPVRWRGCGPRGCRSTPCGCPAPRRSRRRC